MGKSENKNFKSISFEVIDSLKNSGKKKVLLFPVLLAVILLVFVLSAHRSEITLSSSELELSSGEAYALSVDALPKKSDVSELVWSSSDPEVCTVDKGILTPLRSGETVITATLGKQEASCKVHVSLRGYVQIDGDHFYYHDDGTLAATEWVEVDGVKKWFQIDGKEIVPTSLIAFTFDDGPSPYTEEVLEVLKTYGCTATFFQCGYKVEAQADVEKKILEAGSEIGSHTWDHVSLDKLSSEGIQATLRETSDEIFKYCGERPALLRPPYGAVSQTVMNSAGVPLIMWNITDEGLYEDSYILTANAILRSPRDGDIALMHDTHAYCIDTCKYAIPILIQSGFRIVSISDMAEMKGVELKSGQEYFTIQGQADS